MNEIVTLPSNWSLKEDIRAHWSLRAATFDDQFGHRIPPGPEREAWKREFAARLGPAPLDVLEMACGTGQISGVLIELGHRLTGLDFSEAMLERAKARHAGKARFVLGDAEATLEPDASCDAIVCRHLVWTLTEPERALAEWHRLLRPGGHLIVFDGDFVQPTAAGRLARQAIAWLDRLAGVPPRRDPRVEAQHAAILSALPFRDGLRFEVLAAMAEAAGFVSVDRGSYAGIARAQRRGATLQNRLRTIIARRFVLHAHRP